MLQEYNNSIVEQSMTHVGAIQQLTGTACYPLDSGSGLYQTVYWQSYPVYVCTDKTAKAIEVLKALQAEKLLECKSVPKFIELVEKISKLL